MDERYPSEMDRTVALEIRRTLAVVDDLSRRMEVAARAPVAPGSRAAADDALPEARFVSMRAGQELSSAIDHLNTWRLLINGPMVPLHAHITLLRGGMEGAMTCRWLLEPSKPPKTRVARGYAAQLDDYCERGRFETSKETGGSPTTFRGTSAAERIAELVQKRTEVGIPSVGFADPTSLAVKYHIERWFRLASAVVHGKEWALAATEIEPASIEQLAPGVLGGVMRASDDVALALTRVAVRLVEAATADFEAYRAPRRRISKR